MEALGRLFNIVPTADDVEISVKDCSGITFIGVLAGGDTYTVQEHQTAAGAGQDLDVITHWYEATEVDGSVVWTRSSDQTADAAVTSSADVVAIHVDTKSLSDGYSYLSCASTSTGLVYAITHDLNVQRDPANLPALGV